MTEIVFAFIREGSSDDGLLAHIRTLILRSGATSVVGASREYKGTTADRIRLVLNEDSPVDLIFVHRDADEADQTRRRTEIADAAEGLNCLEKVVPVIPVQELEAWLLADEPAIRLAAGKPRGRAELGLPAFNRIESTKSPKEVLRHACIEASETTGSRRQRQGKLFPRTRATLLDRLDHEGPVRDLPSWNSFVNDVRERTHALCNA